MLMRLARLPLPTSRRLSTCVCGFEACLQICPATCGVDLLNSNDERCLAPYQASGWGIVDTALRSVYREPLKETTLLDYGCGDGRVLIAAQRIGVKHAVGIELNETTHSLAVEHVRAALGPAASAGVDVVCGSFSDLPLCDPRLARTRNLLIYSFLLPAGLAVLDRWLVQQLAEGNRGGKSIYLMTIGWPLPKTTSFTLLSSTVVDASGGQTVSLYKLA